MKALSCILLPAVLFFSCNSEVRQKDMSPLLKGLIPYQQRFPRAMVKDTVLNGDSYLKYMVGADTIDATLYIRYGRPGFDSVFKQPDGAPYNCTSWEYAYHTPHVIGLMYECISGRQLLVLPLNARDSIRIFSPLYVSVEDSLLLVEDNQQSATGQPAL
ncbi:MAG TPA: hypothetical protein VLD19_15450, partial [Chitinophagaceae bacterium]|nr:hypothetical protein [Chitinophagaceae bacterium]